MASNPEEQHTKELLRTYLSSQNSSDQKQTATTVSSDVQESGHPDVSNNPGYPWAPDPEEVLQLFEQLKKNQYLNFNWQCPGRRKPYEEVRAPEPEKVLTNTFRRIEIETDDFDFEEESPASSMVRCRPNKAIKKANKKPVTLTGILSNMERHRMMDKMDESSSDK